MKINLKQKKIIITFSIIAIAIIATIFMCFKTVRNKRFSNYSEQSSIKFNEENILDENSTDENSTDENLEDDNFVDLSDENVEDAPDDSSKDAEKEDMDTGSKTNNSSTYYIKINNSANRVNIYEKDENGEYTKLVKQMICSTGSYTPPCGKYPKKIYSLNGQHIRWAKLQGNVYGQFITRITGHILFHSVPYTSSNPSTLEYWEFDKLGTSASGGCIRLQVKDAKWIYDNISKGTTVEFSSDITNSASAPKISSNEERRNWDPTDTDSNNPWKWPKTQVNTNLEQKQEQKEKEEEAAKEKAAQEAAAKEKAAQEAAAKEKAEQEKKDNATENEQNTKKENTTKEKTEQGKNSVNNKIVNESNII